MLYTIYWELTDTNFDGHAVAFQNRFIDPFALISGELGCNANDDNNSFLEIEL